MHMPSAPATLFVPLMLYVWATGAPESSRDVPRVWRL